MKLIRQHKTINVETTLPDRWEPDRKARIFNGKSDKMY
jgi:hypothetical protein